MSSVQIDLSAPSTSTMALQRTAEAYDDRNVVLDCSKSTLRTAAVASDHVPDAKKRKKISYAIEDLLKKDDS